MPFVKGQSGNPAGGKKKKRNLTNLLERIGGEPMMTVLRNLETGDQEFAEIIPEEYLAKTLWYALVNKVFMINVEGKLTAFPIGFSDWLDLTKFLYKQVDGAPNGAVEETDEDGNKFSMDDWKVKRLARLKSVAMLEDTDNSYEDNTVIDLKAKSSDEDTVNKYDDKVFNVSEG